MKLVLAIIHDYDVDRVLRTLLDQGFSVTRIASAGGFLRTGNVTILVGVDDHKVDQCLDLIADSGSRRVVSAPPAAGNEYDDLAANGIADPIVAFIAKLPLPIARYALHLYQ